MQSISVVVFQGDPGVAQSLSASLARKFPSVHLAHSLGELRDAIPQYRADVAILDIEASNFSDVEHLHQDFPGLAIVCTHRVADEEMWAAALNAGATDMCPSRDTASILYSAARSVARGNAAA